MELNPSESVPPAGEDFVHIENPISDPNVEALSQSIVNVEEELRGDDAVNSWSHEDSHSERERVLPQEFSRTVMVLTCDSTAESGKCDVYLVGTAHVFEESCREVQAVVSHLKPQVVFLELCSSRVAVLNPQNLKVPTIGEMVEMWKKKHNMFGILYSWFLAKVANKLEVFPGTEFRVAFEEAIKYGGKVILGDRPVQLKEMYDVDMLTLVIQEMSKEFPTLMETLVHERDQYMSSTLLKVASEHSSVVAVVGRGHLNGIKNNWQQPVALKDLLEIPSPTTTVSTLKTLTSVGAVVAGVAIICGIYLNYRK